MSEPHALVAPYVLDDLAAAVKRRVPRALEVAYALALSLPTDEDAAALAFSVCEVRESPPQDIPEMVRRVMDDAFNKYEALKRGVFAPVNFNNPNVLAFERTWQDEHLLVVNNLASVPQPVKFGSYSGREGWDTLNRIEFTFPARAQLDAYEFLWLLLE